MQPTIRRHDATGTRKALALELKSENRKSYRPRARNETYPVWRMLVERRAARIVLQAALKRARIGASEAAPFRELVRRLTARIKSKNYAIIKTAKPHEIMFTADEAALAKQVGKANIEKIINMVSEIDSAVSKDGDVRGLENDFPEHALWWGARHAELLTQAALINAGMLSRKH